MNTRTHKAVHKIRNLEQSTRPLAAPAKLGSFSDEWTAGRHFFVPYMEDLVADDMDCDEDRVAYRLDGHELRSVDIAMGADDTRIAPKRCRGESRQSHQPYTPTSS